VLPKHVLAGENFDTVWNDGVVDPATGQPIGSGPFLVMGWERGSQITLTRNPRWWGPHLPYLDSIVVRFILDSQAIAQALVSGPVDATNPGGPLLQPAGAPGIELRSSPGAGVRAPGLQRRLRDHAAPVEQWFREAVAYSLDRVVR
jgi:peptide/nickel transport system substrate-binding protein